VQRLKLNTGRRVERVFRRGNTMGVRVPAPWYEAAFARRQALCEHMLVAAERGLAPYLWQGAGATAFA
jgi:hypothetical protein